MKHPFANYRRGTWFTLLGKRNSKHLTLKWYDGRIKKLGKKRPTFTVMRLDTYNVNEEGDYIHMGMFEKSAYYCRFVNAFAYYSNYYT